jgi:hypothetical protein
MNKKVLAITCFLIIFLALISIIPFNGWTIATIVGLLLLLIFWKND